MNSKGSSISCHLSRDVFWVVVCCILDFDCDTLAVVQLAQLTNRVTQASTAHHHLSYCFGEVLVAGEFLLLFERTTKPDYY